MEAGQGGWEFEVTNALPGWDLRIKQPDPPRWRMPLIRVEDSKLGRRLRESKLRPNVPQHAHKRRIAAVSAAKIA